MQELLSFSLYVIKNHGASWNDLAWTLPVLAVLIVGLDLALGVRRVSLGRPRRWLPSIAEDPHSLRSWCLQLSAWGWIVASAELGLHLVIAQVGAHFGAEFFIGLVLVIGVANLLPLWLTRTIWESHLKDLGCYSSPLWAPLEIASGVSFLFSLGGGFFVGPAGLILDGLLRTAECVPPLARMEQQGEIALRGARLP